MLPLDKLKNALRLGRVESGPGLARYARDCWPQALAWGSAELAARAPAAVILPGDESETQAVLAWASVHGLALVPRGGGSGVVGAAVPRNPGCVVLDTALLTGEVSIVDGEGGTAPAARVGAGWYGGALEARLNAEGYSLLNFPASMEVSTVGGWIACDSFGQLSTRYGGIRSQALSVRAALPGGRVVTDAPQTHLGVEGMMGVLTEASLKIRRLPSKRRFFAFAFPGPGEALRFAREAVSSPCPPSVLRVYSPVDAVLSGLRGGGGGHGGGHGLKERIELFALRYARLLNRLAPLAGREWLAILVYEDEPGFEGGPPAPGAGARDLGPEPARRWWDRRFKWSREKLERVFAAGCFADTADMWAPWDRLPGLQKAIHAVLAPRAFTFSHFSHFDKDGACLYATFAGKGDPRGHAEAWGAAMDACVRAGGRVNHHHGYGLAKLPWFEKSPDWERFKALRMERDFRDPDRLLNPGKLLEAACR